MNLRQYRYFVEVAEQLSFSRAAERLNISQSALSRQIQLLEEELGLKLFDRIGRIIALTPAGSEILQHCQAVLNDTELIRLRANELASGSAGLLRIGSTPPALESVVSKSLIEFRRHFPDLEIICTEDSAAMLTEFLHQGRLDLVIMGRHISHDFSERLLCRLHVLAVTPSGHKFEGQGSVEVADLSAEPLLLLKGQYVTRHVFDGACRSAGVDLRIVMESDNPHSLLTLVRAQLGTAIVPNNLMLRDLHDNAVVLRHDNSPLEFMLTVVWDPRRYLSPPAKGFIDQLEHTVCRSGMP